MIDAKMFSKDWVYDKIFGLAEDEVNEIRSNFVDDAKEFFVWKVFKMKEMIQQIQLKIKILKKKMKDGVLVISKI